MQPSQMVTKDVKALAECFRRRGPPSNFESPSGLAKCSISEVQAEREKNHEIARTTKRCPKCDGIFVPSVSSFTISWEEDQVAGSTGNGLLRT